ncbi:MAG: hypothetical protein P1U63_11890 [Coxiellaceae bacterium]|nr:hypothetical protein [Coxiellaceae bacterium]
MNFLTLIKSNVSAGKYPNEILDLKKHHGFWYIKYKVKLMPQERELPLADFLNNDDLVLGVSPVEIRALTQLESYFEKEPQYNIDAEMFNEKTKTYEIILKNKYTKIHTLSINMDDVAFSGVLCDLSQEEAFRLGYSYALRKGQINDNAK